MSLLRVEVEGGKYTVIQNADGSMLLLRYGTTWLDDSAQKSGVPMKMVLCMAQEIQRLRDQLAVDRPVANPDE